MATAEAKARERRYLREPKVVFARPSEEEGRVIVSDMNHENEYSISEEMFKREYSEI